VVAAATARPPRAQAAGGSGQAAQVQALLQKYACAACHGVDRKIVGPAFKDVAAKYHGRADAEAYLAGKIRSGGQGLWGSIPMPPQTLPDADLQLIAKWLAAGASK
jgi:cytochrome c